MRRSEVFSMQVPVELIDRIREEAIKLSAKERKQITAAALIRRILAQTVFTDAERKAMEGK